jgi:hypothetical protein
MTKSTGERRNAGRGGHAVLILNALKTSPQSFQELLTKVPGVYPSVVLSELRKMARSRRSARYLIEDAGQFPKKIPYTSSNGKLPVPHPLDYDWRFTKKTVFSLGKEIIKSTHAGDKLAFLGTPSLFHYFSSPGLDRHITLLDANEALRLYLGADTTTAKFIVCDVTHNRLFRKTFDFVLIDPPWYDETTRSFLACASKLCKLSGAIWLSVPPLGTRPGITRERKRQIQWAAAVGLELEDCEEQVLGYASPPFEQNALRAEGILNISPDWRKGDLLKFRKKFACRISFSVKGPKKNQWVEENFNKVRIRIRLKRKRSQVGDPSLISMVPGDILPSVSRRDSRRTGADVWTSGNRVFKCSDTQTVRKLFDAAARKIAAPNVISEIAIAKNISVSKRVKIFTTYNHIRELLSTEERELQQAIYV